MSGMTMRVIVSSCVGEGGGISLEFFLALGGAKEDIAPPMARAVLCRRRIDRHTADGITDRSGCCTISHSG
jgi:hypothetical protein